MRSSGLFDTDHLAGEDLVQIDLRVVKPMRPHVVTMTALVLNATGSTQLGNALAQELHDRAQAELNEDRSDSTAVKMRSPFRSKVAL